MSAYINRIAEAKGLAKLDAKRPLTIELLPADIEQARRKDASHCAFARATCRSMPKVISAHFYKTTAWIEYKETIVRYSLPESMRKEIISFDRGGTMEPGEYSLCKPSKVIPWKGDVKEIKDHKRSRGARKKRPIRHFATNVRTMATESKLLPERKAHRKADRNV